MKYVITYTGKDYTFNVRCIDHLGKEVEAEAGTFDNYGDAMRYAMGRAAYSCVVLHFLSDGILIEDSLTGDKIVRVQAA